MKVKDEVFQYYHYFIQERMNIFWNRYAGSSDRLTLDPILTTYKFTNVYRAQDRVSQYLIRNVIYSEEARLLNEVDTLLRILVFKIFNNINTWEYLQTNIGTLSSKNFNVDHISHLLAERIKYTPIFSPAYMMTGTHKKYNCYSSKHEKWLRMVEAELLKGKLFEKIIKAKNLEEVYSQLLKCSFIGEFLAYQYAIDFNYSDVINFDENSFVKAGIGAIRGIKKCFEVSRLHSYEDYIRFAQETFLKYQEKYNYKEFKALFGRQPTLIDFQNCFCETDKYLRAKLPELLVGNVRIKQRFRPCQSSIDYFFPPKWNINQHIVSCTFKNIKESTLF